MCAGSLEPQPRQGRNRLFGARSSPRASLERVSGRSVVFAPDDSAERDPPGGPVRAHRRARRPAGPARAGRRSRGRHGASRSRRRLPSLGNDVPRRRGGGRGRRGESTGAREGAGAAWAWRRYASAARPAPAHTLEVRSEDVAADPGAAATLIAARLETDPGPLAEALAAVHSRSVGRWRRDLTAEQVADVERE